MNKSFWEKIKSRKLWLAILNAAAGIAIALGADNNIVQIALGAGLALLSAVSYIVVEGKVDAAAVDLSADAVKKILDLVEQIKQFEEKQKKQELSEAESEKELNA